MITSAYQNEIEMDRVNPAKHTLCHTLIDQAAIEFDHSADIKIRNAPRLFLGRSLDQVMQQAVKIRCLGIGRDDAAHMQAQLIRCRHCHVGEAIDLRHIMRRTIFQKGGEQAMFAAKMVLHKRRTHSRPRTNFSLRKL